LHSVATARRRLLLHHRQNIPCPNRIPHPNHHPNHAPPLRRPQLILHLHRFDNHDCRAFFHLLSIIYQYAHHTSRHGSLHRPRPIHPDSTTAPPLQGTRIIHLKPIPPPPNHHP